MSEETIEAKPMNVKNSEQFEQFAEELLKNWQDYKKLDTRMKLLDATVKKYLVDNGKVSYENVYGSVSLITQNRRVLDRSLINDIEQYKVDSEVKMMFKQPKKLAQ